MTSSGSPFAVNVMLKVSYNFLVPRCRLSMKASSAKKLFICFKVVTPSVYTTPIENVAETVSI